MSGISMLMKNFFISLEIGAPPEIKLMQRLNPRFCLILDETNLFARCIPDCTVPVKLTHDLVTWPAMWFNVLLSNPGTEIGFIDPNPDFSIHSLTLSFAFVVYVDVAGNI
ncbi:hypothetical protein C0J52_00462 [Blattella germanica]|nr:hypothetical protein C0J52_00462 [Blattella germanica]